jgi:diguanylate cyclase
MATRMTRRIFDFSPRGWGRVVAWTVLGTLVCVVVTVFVDSFNFPGMDEGQLTRALLVDIFLPIVLAVPMLLFLTTKLRELAIAHHELARFASTDALTGVLNRGAFTTLVEAYLAQVDADRRRPKGTLLIVDADNFKSINDSYGHDRGDEALQIIARSIRESLRDGDFVGRVGGEEFAVFLPDSDRDQAETAAERLRGTVWDADFTPDGARRRLSVSVGGAAFDRRLPLIELFRIADRQLYAAKRAGRNCVHVAPAASANGRTPVPHAA